MGSKTQYTKLGIGFLLRERPVAALATVATAVRVWTVFPYAVAASTALFLFLGRKLTNITEHRVQDELQFTHKTKLNESGVPEWLNGSLPQMSSKRTTPKL
ncbi:hypothetical protein CFP56_000303 [Quercus suber]|uniref:Uncharacterized protein n=1 Tax=Quercus suber TaxID=58331 RepID=A0AAW0MD69_QUESU